MRKIFKNVLAGVTTTALVAGLFAGVGVTSPVKAEVGNTITGNWVNSAESYEPNDAVISQTTFTSTAESIKANISITGWQANWIAESQAPDDAIIVGDGDGKIWGEKPYQINSKNTALIVPGETYKFKFTVKNGMMAADTTTPTEKNITITINSGIEGDNDNTMLFETVTVPAGATETYEFDVPVSADYMNDTVSIQLSYGSYFYSYTLTEAVKKGQVSDADAKACKYAYAYGTSENVNAHGTLEFTNIALEGQKGEIHTPYIPETTTAKKTQPTTKKAEPTTKKKTPVTKKTKKFAKVKKVKAKSKKGKITVTWNKVKNAKKYSVKVGKTTYKNIKGKKYVVKKKIKVGKTYKVKVRAMKASGYKQGAWSKAVKVKVKK